MTIGWWPLVGGNWLVTIRGWQLIVDNWLMTSYWWQLVGGSWQVETGERGGGRRSGHRAKNQNPTRQRGEKTWHDLSDRVFLGPVQPPKLCAATLQY